MLKWLTSQGGGALLYDGTILKVTDPRASRWEKKTLFIQKKLKYDKTNVRLHKQKIKTKTLKERSITIEIEQ